MSVVEKILEERAKTHGMFVDHASITQQIKTLLGSHSNKLSVVQKEALDMIAHKIGRILAGDPNHKDHWDDIAGYATLVSKELAQRPDIPVDRQPVDKYKQFKV
jgi:hypothetical protein